MITAVIWAIITAVGSLVAAANVADSLVYLGRIRRARPDLVRSYALEVILDCSIVLVQGAFLLAGTLALVSFSITDELMRQVVSSAMLVALFAGPIVLALVSVHRYWRRRARS